MIKIQLLNPLFRVYSQGRCCTAVRYLEKKHEKNKHSFSLSHLKVFSSRSDKNTGFLSAESLYNDTPYSDKSFFRDRHRIARIVENMTEATPSMMRAVLSHKGNKRELITTLVPTPGQNEVLIKNVTLSSVYLGR